MLIVVPWSSFWDRNYFVDSLPGLRSAIDNYFVRGAVSGLGLINLWAGLADLVAIVGGWRARRLAAALPAPHGREPAAEWPGRGEGSA